jgi:prevent-host-death family protein
MVSTARKTGTDEPADLVLGVAEAKARLSELIARAERGERVVIARGDEPAVELRPLSERRSPIGVLARLGIAVDLDAVHAGIDERWSEADLADFEGGLEDELRG